MIVDRMREILAEVYSQSFVDKKSDAQILAIYAKWLEKENKKK